MWKFIVLISFLIVVIVPSGTAQKVLLHEDVYSYFQTTDNYGPNLKHYRWLYIDYGNFADKSEGTNFSTIPLRTYSFSAGFKYKRKLFKPLALGIGVEYNLNNFTINQTTGKNFPTQVLHSKERIRLHRTGAELFARFSALNRGNFMGLYLDFGYYYNYAFSTRLIVLDKYETPMYGAKTIEVLYKNLDYVNNLNHGARVRIGYNRYVIFADYRVSELLKKQTEVKLPRLTAGIQLALH